MASIKCPKCGSEDVVVGEDAMVCQKCQHRFTPPGDPEVGIGPGFPFRLVTCPICAHQVSTGAANCPSCGQQLHPTSSLSLAWKIVKVSFFVLLILFVIVLVLWKILITLVKPEL